MHDEVFAQLEVDLLDVWGTVSSEYVEDAPAEQPHPASRAKTPDGRPKTPAGAYDSMSHHSRPASKHKKKKAHRGSKPRSRAEALAALGADVGAAVLIQAAWRGHTARHRAAVREQAIRDMVAQSAVSAETVRVLGRQQQKQLGAVRRRETDKAAERVADRSKMLGKLVEVVDESLGTAAMGTPTEGDEDGDGEDDAQQIREIAQIFRHKRPRAMRQCWWIPKEARRVFCRTVAEREAKVGERILQMLRRSTLEHYYSVEQLRRVMDIVPRCARIETIIAIWARLVDLQNFRAHDFVDREGYAVLQRRLGAANLFNPIRPEGWYHLEMKEKDCQKVAQCLVQLSTEEPGDNMKNEIYNGNHIEIGTHWLTAVPDIGTPSPALACSPSSCCADASAPALPRRGVRGGVRDDAAQREPADPAGACEAAAHARPRRRPLVPPQPSRALGVTLPGLTHAWGRAAIPEEHRDPNFDPEEADGPEEEPVDLMPDGLLAERGWMKTWLGKHPSCAY